MCPLFDAHAHYFDKRFEESPVGGAEKLMGSLFGDNVGVIVNCATTTDDAKFCIEYAEKFDGCYAAVGVHPSDCGAEKSVEDAISKLRAMAKHPKVVALGEVGLDYHWENNPEKSVQFSYFKAQLDLARELSLPVVAHIRDAQGDAFDILSEYPDLKVMLHCYSGSPEMARQYLMKGDRYFSFGGVLTYKNAMHTVESAKLIPLDRILTETDCPYLAPVPYRGKMNHSGYMIETLKKLAEIKSLPLEELADSVYENGKRFYAI